jgi:beta-glucosidase
MKMTTYAYADPTRSMDERVEDLLSRMTLEEKIAQLGAVKFPDLISGGRFDEDTALRAVPHGVGQVTRIGATTGLHPAQSAELFNQIQRLVVERTRLGIPVIVHEESLAGYCARDATVFPQALGLACTWDPSLVEEVAGAVREQLMAVGARQSLAPVLDIARDPRWGRLEETYGEDPVLAGTLGAAYVRGMQTADLSRGVLATRKHFLAHGLSEGGRNHAPVQVGPRELREVYAEPFAAAIREAGLASVMSSYSCVDGLPGSGSYEILTELLRDELGFEGLVVADYFAVSLLSSYHRVAADKAEAAVKAITAGLDLELPALDCFGEPLKAAIAAGKVGMEVLHTAVRRVLATKVRLGLFESPYVDPAAAAAAFERPGNVELARRAAARGMVLLQNDGALPLAPDLKRVAVIGPAADDQRLLQGDYHYPAHNEPLLQRMADAGTDGAAVGGELIYLPSGGDGAFQPGWHYTAHVTPLQGLRAVLGPATEVVYEKGCELSGADTSLFPAAVAAAASAEVAIVVVGGRSGLSRSSTVGEGCDAADLRLTGAQEQLVAAVAATSTPTVAVVMSGRAHELSAVARQASALLVAWPLGQEGGNALAEVLSGRRSPCGRLPVSLPRSTGQVPLYHSHRSGGAKSMFYGDYTDTGHTPLFAFGHGLAYTTFGYSDLSVAATDTRSPVEVELSVANTGAREGEEVVQLYVSDLVASVARPERSLAGFARVKLEPGESAKVAFRVHPSRLAFYDEKMRFVVEPGEFRFSVGSSAAALHAEAAVGLSGDVARYSQRSVVATRATVNVLR